MMREKINLTIISPPGYIHSLGFLDSAFMFKECLEASDFDVSVSKNRLRYDSVNFCFGGHLSPELLQSSGYRIVIVNLEQISVANLPESYLSLLKSLPSIDYSSVNLPHHGGVTTLFSAGFFSPVGEENSRFYLSGGDSYLADFIFFGSMNQSRREIIEEIEELGATVLTFDKPLYGPERDFYIRRCKACLSIPYYDGAIFEDIRAALSLSLGVPVVSVGGTGRSVIREKGCFSVEASELDHFIKLIFPAAEFREQAEDKLNWFLGHAPRIDDLGSFINSANEFYLKNIDGAAPTPRRLNVGSGKSYKPGWLNIDVDKWSNPDVKLDLSDSVVELPLKCESFFQDLEVELVAGGFELVLLDNVLEHVGNVPALMTNILNLLQLGGKVQIIVPYERSKTAWQDPTHVRAFNENSFLYFTDWFWYLGWVMERFAIVSSGYFSLDMKPCSRSDDAAFLSVLMEKVETTPAERNTARIMSSDFLLGGKHLSR